MRRFVEEREQEEREEILESLQHAQSPLGMVSQDPVLNELVVLLQRLRVQHEEDPRKRLEFTFSRRHVEAARAAFDEMLRRGERGLHELCDLLADTLLEDYQLQSVVIGEVDGTGERFVLATDIDRSHLYDISDINFGNSQLEPLRFVRDEELRRASLVSNVVEYQATEPNRFAIYKILSRVKAEEEIWNKVVDEIFNLDAIVLRDKSLRHLSRFVKDVFGVKIVVGDKDAVYKLQKALATTEWPSENLGALQIESTEQARRFDFVEVKDYLGREHRKRSGWSAMKSVVRWREKTFEIQIQPLGNYLHERELLTRESHSSFKVRREQLRADIAERIPLFGFYLRLLRWLFIEPDAPPPRFGDAVVELKD